jgi:hypothetical protein
VDDGALPGERTVSRFASALAWVRRRPGTLAIAAVAVCWGVVMHSSGWAQMAHFSEVRALAAGEKTIDRWHWETGDVAWIDGHYYSVKSPGVAAISTPLYMLIDATGGLDLAASAAHQASLADNPRWVSNEEPPFARYGYDPGRARLIERRIEESTPVLWALTLLAAVVPSVLMLVMVRRVGDRFAPGYGTAAAVTLAVSTILLVFGAELFSHAISAAIGFAAFVVLIRERAGPPRIGAVALAGLLAGLAVTFEYQTGLVGFVLFFYAVARSGWPRRALAYGAGALAGVIPVFAFNAWTLGSPFELAYGNAVATLGLSGHATVGLNSDGFFGITMPKSEAAIDLLFSGRGLLVLTPVLVLGVVGTVIALRSGRNRAEAWTILGVAGAYFVYNCGYWQPFGGGTPGPRFLVPALPFLAVGLAVAYRRLPTTTLALAIPSALWMLVATVTYPLIGEQGTGLWVDDLADGTLEHTLLTVLGVRSGWVAILPVALAIAAAAWFAIRATPRPVAAASRDWAIAVAALCLWVAASVLGPVFAEDPTTPIDGSVSSLAVVAVGALASAAVIAATAPRWRLPRAQPTGVTAELALGERRS